MSPEEELDLIHEILIKESILSDGSRELEIKKHLDKGWYQRVLQSERKYAYLLEFNLLPVNKIKIMRLSCNKFLFGFPHKQNYKVFLIKDSIDYFSCPEDIFYFIRGALP